MISSSDDRKYMKRTIPAIQSRLIVACGCGDCKDKNCQCIHNKEADKGNNAKANKAGTNRKPKK